MPDRNGIEIAQQYASHYNLEPKGDQESNARFRERVADHVRKQGLYVDAHEVLNNCYHDEKREGEDANPVVTGVTGVCALGLNGTLGRRATTVGDDIAAGVVVQNHDPDRDEALILWAMMLGGGR